MGGGGDMVNSFDVNLIRGHVMRQFQVAHCRNDVISSWGQAGVKATQKSRGFHEAEGRVKSPYEPELVGCHLCHRRVWFFTLVLHYYNVSIHRLLMEHVNYLPCPTASGKKIWS